MEFKQIKATISYNKAKVNDWDNLAVPIDRGLIVYSNDSQEFKMGNGRDVYSMLPVMFNLRNMGKIIDFTKDYIDPTLQNANRLVVIDKHGKGLEFSNVLVTDLITDENFLAILKDYAKITHNHDELIYKKPEVDALLETHGGGLNFSDRAQQLLAYLIMLRINKNNQTHLTLPNGFSDEYNDLKDLEVTGRKVKHNTTYLSSLPVTNKQDFVVESKVRLSDKNISRVSTYLRADFDFKRQEHFLELSRDGGDTWSVVELKEHEFSNTFLKTYHGICDYNKKLFYGTFEDITFDIHNLKRLEGLKFIVDSANKGHFNMSLDSRVKRCMDVITPDGTVAIESLSGDGTGSESVEFIGNFSGSTDTHAVEYITGAKVSDEHVGLANYFDPSKRIWDVVDIKSVLAGEHNGALNQSIFYDGNYWSILWDYGLATFNFSDLKFEGVYKVTSDRGAGTLAIHNDIMYLYSGYLNDTATGAITSYNVKTKEVRTDYPRSAYRVNGSAVAVYNNKIWIFGGRDPDANDPRAQLESFDLTTETWKVEIHHVTDIGFWYSGPHFQKDNLLYIFGGNYGSDQVKVIDLDTLQVKKLSKFPKYLYRGIGCELNENEFMIAPVLHWGYIPIFIYNHSKDIVKAYKHDMDVTSISSWMTATFLDRKTNDIVFSDGYHVKNSCRFNLNDLITANIYNTKLQTDHLQKIHSSASTIYNDVVYMFGGTDDNRIEDKLVKYNPKEETEALLKTGPSARFGSSVVRHNANLYVYGGETSKGVYSSELWKYNTLTDTWEQLLDAPVASSGIPIACYNDKLLLFNVGTIDLDNNTTSNKFYNLTYDLNTNTWTSLTSSPEVGDPSIKASYVQKDDKLYLYGGILKSTKQVTDKLIEIDLNTKNSKELRVGPYASFGSGMSFYKDMLYILGGRKVANDPNSTTNAQWRYNIKDDLWVEEPVPQIDLKTLSHMTYELTPWGTLIYGGKHKATTNLDELITIRRRENLEGNSLGYLILEDETTLSRIESTYGEIQLVPKVDDTYVIFKDDAWETIVKKDNNDNWLYRSDAGGFKKCTTNTEDAALLDALDQSINKAFYNTKTNDWPLYELKTTKVGIVVNIDRHTFLRSDTKVVLLKPAAFTKGRDFKYRINSKQVETTMDLHGSIFRWK